MTPFHPLELHCLNIPNELHTKVAMYGDRQSYKINIYLVLVIGDGLRRTQMECGFLIGQQLLHLVRSYTNVSANKLVLVDVSVTKLA